MEIGSASYRQGVDASHPAHTTPYDGSSKPFTIGLKPLHAAEWIEVDGQLEAYLCEKDRLYDSVPEQIFAAESDTADLSIKYLICW